MIGAADVLKAVIRDLDWDKIECKSALKGITWKLSPADSPWWNSCCEALIRSAKKAIDLATRESKVTFSELQTVFFQCANILNERPIGINPAKQNDYSYICPNDILLGRSTSNPPEELFCEKTNIAKRVMFLENIVNSFWKKWTSSYFPSLLIEQKWHHARRNVSKGELSSLVGKDSRKRKKH